MLITRASVIPLTYGKQQMLIKPWVRRYPLSPIRDWFWKDVVIERH
jgi:hypothetical protein